MQTDLQFHDAARPLPGRFADFTPPHAPVQSAVAASALFLFPHPGRSLGGDRLLVYLPGRGCNPISSSTMSLVPFPEGSPTSLPHTDLSSQQSLHQPLFLFPHPGRSLGGDRLLVYLPGRGCKPISSSTTPLVPFPEGSPTSLPHTDLPSQQPLHKPLFLFPHPGRSLRDDRLLVYLPGRGCNPISSSTCHFTCDSDP